MQRWVVMGSLLLLMAGCVQDPERQAVRVNTSALEHQRRTRQQTVDTQVQQLSDRLTQCEHTQEAIRRDVARVAAAVEEFRGQLHRAQEGIQETQRQVPRVTTAEERGAATRVTNMETRLRALQKHLRGAPQ